MYYTSIVFNISNYKKENKIIDLKSLTIIKVAREV